jgi:enoyl-CoA hydratase/carnithine racemase
MGLVEAGVGLIPGGGGTKEMALRACDLALAIAPPEPKDAPSKFAQSGEYAAALKQSLETIAMAKVSNSAAEARTLGLLAPQDRVTRNRDRLLLDAKAQAALLADQGYVAPIPRTAIPAAGLAVLPTLETGIFLMGEDLPLSTTRKWRAKRRMSFAEAELRREAWFPNSICSISSGRRFFPFAASGRRRSASHSRSKPESR